MVVSGRNPFASAANNTYAQLSFDFKIEMEVPFYTDNLGWLCSGLSTRSAKVRVVRGGSGLAWRAATAPKSGPIIVGWK